MRALILGDIHRKWGIADRVYLEVSRGEDLDVLIQVGDFGYWPRGSHSVWGREFDHPCWFIDGNHEDHEMLKCVNESYLGLDPYHSYSAWPGMMKHWEYKHRGAIDCGILFVGGADSINKHELTPGLDWFPEENIGYEDQNRVMDAVDSYGAGNIHTVISHDCPTSFEVAELCAGPEFDDGNRRFLQEVLERVKPERWYFGHYHGRLSGVESGTKWRCIDQVDAGDFVLVDLPEE